MTGSITSSSSGIDTTVSSTAQIGTTNCLAATTTLPLTGRPGARRGFGHSMGLQPERSGVDHVLVRSSRGNVMPTTNARLGAACETDGSAR